MGEAVLSSLARASSSRAAPKFEPPPDLCTPLRLPRNVVGRAVEVYWAGDARWYRATVVKCDYVNQAVCIQYEGESYGKDTDGEWEPALAAGMRFCSAPSPTGNSWEKLTKPEQAAAEVLGWNEKSWNCGDKQPYSAIWSEETQDKQQAALSVLGLDPDLFAGFPSGSDGQGKFKSAKLSHWAGHDGWMYRRGTGLVTFYYISPDGQEYTSEQEAEAAYEAYEEENDSEDDDLEQRQTSLSRGAKAAAAAAAALKGGAGKAKRPHAASPDVEGSPTKKARAASPDADAGKREAALNANRGAGGVSALDCGPGTSIAGSFIDDSCIGRLVAVFWPSHVGHGPSWFEGEITAFNKKSRKHRVRYTDGREEWSDLVTCGRFLSDDADGDAVVRRAQLAEGGSPRLAPSLFADLSTATRNRAGPSSPTGDDDTVATRSAAGSASGVAGDESTVQKGRIVPKNAAERRAAAAKGLLRRTGRAVKTAAELEKEKVEQAKLIAEKKKQMAQQLRAKQRQVAAEKKVAAKQARVQVAAAAAVATQLERNQGTGKMSAGTGKVSGEKSIAVVAPPIVKALLPVLSLEHDQRAPILYALDKALRRAKPPSAVHTHIRKVHHQLKVQLTGAAEAKAAIRAMLQSSEKLESIDGKRVKVFWPGDARWYPARLDRRTPNPGPDSRESTMMTARRTAMICQRLHGELCRNEGSSAGTIMAPDSTKLVVAA